MAQYIHFTDERFFCCLSGSGSQSDGSYITGNNSGNGKYQ